MSSETHGQVRRVAGPVVGVSGLRHVRLYDVVEVGHLGLVGEVIRFSGDQITVQVYEDTSGIRIGEPVRHTGQPLVACLGPGLLGRVFDGLQRPLHDLAAISGDYIRRGLKAPALPYDRVWQFSPCVSIGDQVGPGDVIGKVGETSSIEHLIMVPSGMAGRVLEINPGEHRLQETVCVLECDRGGRSRQHSLSMEQQWPVRTPRPVQRMLDPSEPLLTGTRIIDVFFPVAKGGAAIIPGGFGTGKTVTEHSLARLADADVVVYVGCGERGNEMTEVLEDFPQLEDPRNGAPLMDRTVLIANTSNMPVAAREASVYMGITIAEYYRDMGYDVLLLADSTSRWGEALREISGRLEEMPGEEGYPAYLAARLAEFYERSGRAVCLGRRLDQPHEPGRSGSVTVVGAVSPPGGDFSEPMTQSSMRVAGTFWALDYDLSRRRHFPAINWTRSYSLYKLSRWYEREVSPDWQDLIVEAMALLQREAELLEIVQLVGTEALSEVERAVLIAARMMREDFLQQSAYHEVDRFCQADKAYWMLKAILGFYHRLRQVAEAGVDLGKASRLPITAEIAHMRELPRKDEIPAIKSIVERLDSAFQGLEAS